MLLHIFQCDHPSRTPFITESLYLLSFLVFLRPEFAFLFSQDDFISPLTSLVLSDELINLSDCENAISALFCLLNGREIPRCRLEILLLNFGRFSEICRIRHVNGRLLPSIVRQALQIGIDPQWHPMLASVLSSLLSFDSYSDIAVSYSKIMILNETMAVILARHGFLNHLLTVEFHEGAPSLTEALTVARIAYARLEDWNDLRTELLAGIPWNRVRDALDERDCREVVAALELLKETLPEGMLNLKMVRGELEGGLIEKGILPILGDRSFAEKVAVLAVLQKLARFSEAGREALYWDGFFTVWCDVLMSEMEGLIGQVLDLVGELVCQIGECQIGYKRFIEGLAGNELAVVIAEMRMDENEEVAEKAKWIIRSIQTQLDNFGQS
jgi:hypothetical protein